MKKNVFILLCVVLCMFCFTAGVSAAAEPWDGTIDTSWYNTTDTEFEISTPQQLAGLAKIVIGQADGIARDQFAGKTVTLTSNLDLGGVKGENGWSGQSWTPIGTYGPWPYYSFNGNFNGNGKKISNLYIEADDNMCHALFGNFNGGRLSNLSIVSGYIKGAGTRDCGALIGYASGTTVVLNCSNGADVEGTQSCGGLVGYVNSVNARIYNCFNTGDVTVDKTYAGGILGQGGCGIANCYNTGDIASRLDTSNTRIGGICGSFTQTTATVQNCYNAGKITSVCADAPVNGGIIGYFTRTSGVDNCCYLKEEGLNGIANTPDFEGVYAKEAAELKESAELLGDGFAADTASVNGGYPILNWQKGTYDPDETVGLDILGFTGGTNKGFTVLLNKNLGYTVPTKAQFTVSVKVNGEAVTPSNLNGTLTVAKKDSKNYTAMAFTFGDNLLPEADYEITAKFGDGETKTYTYSVGETDEWSDYAATGFAKGDGSLNDPYVIETAGELSYMSRFASANGNWGQKYFVLGADIDLSGKLWTPNYFGGNLDGRNHVISGLTIDDTAGSYFNGGSGFFSTLKPVKNGGVYGIIHLQNLHFTDVSVKGSDSVGVIAGTAANCIIENCSVDGGEVSDYSGSNYVGGLVGKLDAGAATRDGFDCEISRCSVDLNVEGIRSAGGLVGMFDHGNENYGTSYISDCYTEGKVTCTAGMGYCGGIAGVVQRQQGVTIENSYSVMEVGGTSLCAGGLVGKLWITGNMNQYIGPDGLTIANSVALNRSVSSGRESGISSRIVPEGQDIIDNSKGTFINNYALDTMKVDGGYVEDDNHGNAKGVSREEASLKSFWAETLSFDFGENGAWKWDGENGVPVLNSGLLAETKVVIETQPVDGKAFSNYPAKFGVVASDGTMRYTYQWEASTDGETWTPVENGTGDALTVTCLDPYTTGTLFRCIVTDSGGHQAVSDAAVFRKSSGKYQPEDALKAVASFYAGKTSLEAAGDALGVYAALGGFEGFADTEIPYYEQYITGASNSLINGRIQTLMIDRYVLGDDPHDYLKTGEGQCFTADIFEDILSLQNAETGELMYFKDCHLDSRCHSTYMPSLINYLEMYYHGKAWGNEAEGTLLGRDGAIEYLFGLLKDHECGGKYFVWLYDSSYSGFDWEILNSYNAQAEFVILMARLCDDPVYGERAEQAMYDVLKTMEYLYDEDAFSDTEGYARYASAFIAAGSHTDSYFKKSAYFNLADEIVREKLMTSAAVDGSYCAVAGTSSMTGDAYATSAVAVALRDYAEENSFLAEYEYLLSDEVSIADDLAAIVIANPVTSDITLPVEGENGTVITWSTSDDKIITAKGKVTRRSANQEVTLTAVCEKNGKTAERSFELIVKAAADADTDAVDAVLAGINFPSETLTGFDMPVSSDDSVALTLDISDTAVIAADGKVTRPAKGEDDAVVTITAKAVSGDVEKTKAFEIKVYAETEDSLKEGYYQTRIKYLNQKVLNGYWEIWAAYASLGDMIADPANGYTFIFADPSSSWYGTQYGAQVMGLVAAGENPYDYNGKNWVELLKKNYGGAFAAGVYSAFGMEAAGAGSDYYTPAVDNQLTQLKPESMTLGIDISGWAALLVAKHTAMEGGASNIAALNNYLSYLSTLGIDENGNFAGSNCISTSCVLLAYPAMYAAGVEKADPYSDDWKNSVSGKNIVDAIYDLGIAGGAYPGYEEQYELAVCDLYHAIYDNGTSTWISICVSEDKLNALMEKANGILENSDAYEKDSVEAVQAALDTVKGISEDRLSAAVADYGEEYYGLYDAVRFAKTVGGEDVNQKAAAAAEAKINALPDASALTLEDKAAVEAAQAAYAGLTDIQKELVSDDAAAKLNAAVAAIAELEKSSGKDAGTVTISIEKFTLGQGYLCEPKTFAVKESDTVGSLTERFAAEQGIDLRITGGYYLAAIEDAEAPLQVPQYILDAMEAGGDTLGDRDDANWLSEFDYSMYSGWMIWVNNVDIDKSAWDWPVKDGDVLRWQFTLYGLGKDLGAVSFGDKAFTPNVNKDELTETLASGGAVKVKGSDAYQAAVAAASDMTSTQERIDKANADLKDYIENSGKTKNLPFTDVEKGKWYYDSVAYVYNNGIMNGTGDGTTFEPGATLTRAMYVTMLYRLEGEPAVSGSCAFSDVKAGSWYEKAVIWANANGIVKGTSAAAFSPEAEISREQMAVMMYRYAEFAGKDITVKGDVSKFKDAAEISSWAGDAMVWANGSGIITGKDGNLLAPKASASRAEAATVFMRFMQAE